MKYPLLILFLLVLTSSCQFFETEKISSESFYEEDLKTIDWNDIDQYPTFSSCKEFTDKAEQKTCFVNAISSHIYQSIEDRKLTAIHRFHDTIEIDFSVSKTGQLQILKIKMDSLLDVQLPGLKDLIPKSIDSISIDAPAYKRGIPVNTTFTLPIVFKTD